MKMIEVQNLCFAYKSKKCNLPVFQDLNLNVARGDFVAIKGLSGSGKSTLLHLIAGLLKPQKGTISINGSNIGQCSDLELSLLRNQTYGFVFQHCYLLPYLNVLENILLPIFYPIEFKEQNFQKWRVEDLAHQLDLTDKLLSYPHELSGGQQQKVAMARAFINDPSLILADEPTGHLDSQSTNQVMRIFQDLNVKHSKTILMMTHEPSVFKFASKILTLTESRLIERWSKIQKHLYKPLNKNKNKQRNGKQKNQISLFAQMLKLIPLCLTNILQNKIRSLLMVMGIIVGVASLYVIFALGGFVKQNILEGYRDVGANTFILRGSSNWQLKAMDVFPVQFAFFDWEKEILPLKSIFSGIQRLSPYLEGWETSVNFAGQSIDKEVRLVGVSEEGLTILNRQLLAGIGINAYHVEKRDSVCVIGFEVGERLFRNTFPIGQILSISQQSYNTFTCRVIGLLESKTSHRGYSKSNLQVFVPFTVYQMFNEYWDWQITNVLMQVKDGRDIQGMGLALQNLFAARYGSSGIFEVDSDNFLLQQMQMFLGLLAILLTGVVLMMLWVGASGITHQMLVSLLERIQDIGLRKAIGATHASLRHQFLLEALILSGLGGLLGLMLGLLISHFVIYMASLWVEGVVFEWMIEPYAILLSVCSICVVGILSGWIPAMKAKNLQVIDRMTS